MANKTRAFIVCDTPVPRFATEKLGQTTENYLDDMMQTN